MNIKIKKTIILLTLTSLIIASIGCTSNGIESDSPAPSGNSNEAAPLKDDRPSDSATLTDEEIAKIGAILGNYDAENITAEDALEMNEAFRDAGIRGGATVGAAMRSFGFDNERIRELAPPPNRDKNKQEGGNQQNTETRPEPRPENDSNGEQPMRNEQIDPNSQGQKQGQNYSIEQAISDNAQLHTIAFDALAYFTGELGADSFLPPGKLSDYFGFQYFRDVDEGELGHNTSFLTRIADNIFYILNNDQITQMKSLAEEQTALISEYGYSRFPLMKAFRRLQEGDLPSGSTELDLDAVKEYSANIYEIDGELSYTRAKVLGSIINSLTDEQRSYLDEMAAGSSLTWTDFSEEQLAKEGLSHDEHVAMMTYASEMFSWYAGNIESDTYFCPERQGTYFGSFYMKDMPAMGNPDYSISTSITGDNGKAFLNALTADQRELIESLIDLQKDELLEIVETRRAIATELRQFIAGNSVNEDKVMELSRKYGELDGELVHAYATHFAEVSKTLTDEQMEFFMELRNLDGYVVKGAFLFSEEIEMPNIINTDFLFE